MRRIFGKIYRIATFKDDSFDIIYIIGCIFLLLALIILIPIIPLILWVYIFFALLVDKFKLYKAKLTGDQFEYKFYRKIYTIDKAALRDIVPETYKDMFKSSNDDELHKEE